jgi:uncharacterized membrane protein YphA (DoxX/SURF4 family)
MARMVLGARVILGLIFFVFGLNGFLHFMPLPPLPPSAGEFIMALVNTGYMMTVVKAMEVLGGVLLLSGYFVPFALVWLAPIVFNIFMFHLMLAPGGLVIPVVVLGLEVFLVYAHIDHFKGLFQPKAQPTV